MVASLGSMSSGPSFRTSLTRVDTVWMSRMPSGAGTRKDRSSPVSCSSGSSQVAHVSLGSRTGIRSWIAVTSSLASVVMTAAEVIQSPVSGSFQTDQRPAIASTAPPPIGPRKNGWRRLPSVRCHS